MNLIIDGNNMAHRAKYAFQQLAYQGKSTSVMYGVLRMTVSLIRKYKPTSIIMCWDDGVPGFRRRLVPGYKAHREKRDEDDSEWLSFMSQMGELRGILPYTGALQVRRTGIEADDLMAQAARMVIGKSIIVSGDKDMLQCVSDSVSVLKSGSSKDTLMTIGNFEDVIGFPPFKYVLFKVLQGDSSDNIPGVPGIGPKTAEKLVMNNTPIAGATPTIAKSITEFVSSGQYNAAYTVMDLTEDRAGARMAILSAEWVRYSNQLYSWCMSKGFMSLIEAGPLAAIFGRLKQPKFDTTDMRIPLVWDYDRSIRHR